MSDTIKIFEHSEFGNLRVVERDGETWFVAKDVCNSLGILNVSDTLSKSLDADEKGVDSIYTLGGMQRMATVNESGLNTLVLQSRKPEARRFRKWVTSEVLPSIAKTGRYDMSASALPDFANPAESARAWAEQYEQHKLSETKALALTAQIERDKPKVLFANSQHIYRQTEAHHVPTN